MRKRYMFLPFFFSVCLWCLTAPPSRLNGRFVFRQWPRLLYVGWLIFVLLLHRRTKEGKNETPPQNNDTFRMHCWPRAFAFTYHPLLCYPRHRMKPWYPMAWLKQKWYPLSRQFLNPSHRSCDIRVYYTYIYLQLSAARLLLKVVMGIAF